jgi:hypothetical protein
VAKLGVAVDEADESVLWLMGIVQGGIRTNAEATYLLGEGGELRAILSKSHKTARENRRRKKSQKKVTNSPIREFTKSI